MNIVQSVLLLIYLAEVIDLSSCYAFGELNIDK